MTGQKLNLEMLKLVRTAKKVKQKDLANILGYATSAGYQLLEKGERNISAENLKKISDYLGVDMEIFFAKQINKTKNIEHIV
jgi:transcriptional regulator with XRE-family HTH domain